MARTSDDSIIDGLSSDPTTLQNGLSPVGRALVVSLDRAVAIQTAAIESYVHYIRRRNPEASPAEIQVLLDRHFVRLASGTGASVGAAAAIPGIGFATGTAAVAGESVVFLDTAAFYVMASAYLRGVDIRDPERRRALVLVALLGAKGTAVVEALVGDLGEIGPDGQVSPAAAIGRFSGPKLGTLNNELLNMALRRVSRRLMRGWIGKILPLGIGAVAGTIANRRLARSITGNAGASLGPLPSRFLTPLPERPPRKSRKQRRAEAKQVEQAEPATGRFKAVLRRLRPGSPGDTDGTDDTDDADGNDTGDALAGESLTGDAEADADLDRLALTAIASTTDSTTGPADSENPDLDASREPRR